MEAAAQPSALAGFMPIIAIFAIFYFLVIRPQQKQASQHKKMLADLKKGDRVLTNGGLYGTVVTLKGADVDLNIAQDVKVLVARSSISRLANPEHTLQSQAASSS